MANFRIQTCVLKDLLESEKNRVKLSTNELNLVRNKLEEERKTSKTLNEVSFILLIGLYLLSQHNLKKIIQLKTYTKTPWLVKCFCIGEITSSVIFYRNPIVSIYSELIIGLIERSELTTCISL